MDLLKMIMIPSGIILFVVSLSLFIMMRIKDSKKKNEFIQYCINKGNEALLISLGYCNKDLEREERRVLNFDKALKDAYKKDGDEVYLDYMNFCRKATTKEISLFLLSFFSFALFIIFINGL